MSKKLRVLVCGDRNWANRKLIRSRLIITQIISNIEVLIEGECSGADRIAREEAEKLGIKVMPFPAKWSKYGRAAGPIRNQRMIDEGKPDLVLAFHNNLDKSRGTKDMINRAQKAGIKFIVVSE